MYATIARWTALFGYFGLLGTLSIWHAWISPAERVPTALVLIVLLTPLLFPLRGLLQGKPYTHAWTGILSLLYFTLGVGHAAVAEERFYGAILIVTSLLLFSGSVLYARLRGRQLKHEQKRQTDE